MVGPSANLLLSMLIDYFVGCVRSISEVNYFVALPMRACGIISIDFLRIMCYNEW